MHIYIYIFSFFFCFLKNAYLYVHLFDNWVKWKNAHIYICFFFFFLFLKKCTHIYMFFFRSLFILKKCTSIYNTYNFAVFKSVHLYMTFFCFLFVFILFWRKADDYCLKIQSINIVFWHFKKCIPLHHILACVLRERIYFVLHYMYDFVTKTEVTYFLWACFSLFLMKIKRYILNFWGNIDACIFSDKIYMHKLGVHFFFAKFFWRKYPKKKCTSFWFAAMMRSRCGHSSGHVAGREAGRTTETAGRIFYMFPTYMSGTYKSFYTLTQ